MCAQPRARQAPPGRMVLQDPVSPCCSQRMVTKHGGPGRPDFQGGRSGWARSPGPGGRSEQPPLGPRPLGQTKPSACQAAGRRQQGGRGGTPHAGHLPAAGIYPAGPARFLLAAQWPPVQGRQSPSVLSGPPRRVPLELTPPGWAAWGDSPGPQRPRRCDHHKHSVTLQARAGGIPTVLTKSTAPQLSWAPARPRPQRGGAGGGSVAQWFQGTLHATQRPRVTGPHLQGTASAGKSGVRQHSLAAGLGVGR